MCSIMGFPGRFRARAVQRLPVPEPVLGVELGSSYSGVDSWGRHIILPEARKQLDGRTRSTGRAEVSDAKNTRK